MKTHTDLGPEGTFVAWLEMMEECGHLSVRTTASAIAIWLDLWDHTQGEIQNLSHPRLFPGVSRAIGLEFLQGSRHLVGLIGETGRVGWFCEIDGEIHWDIPPGKRKTPLPLPKIVYNLIDLMLE